MKYLIGMILSTTLLSSPAFAENEPDHGQFYENAEEEELTEKFALPYHNEGQRAFHGSAEFCAMVMDVVANNSEEFKNVTCN